MPSLSLSKTLIAAIAATCSLAAQTTVTIPCLQDNTLYEDPTGSLSNGAGPALFVGITGQPANATRRCLMKFDVALAVPAGAHVVSAQLTIRTVQSAFAGNVDVFGHRALQAWGEGLSVAPGGGGSGGAALPGDATWLHTFTRSSFWSNAGGDFAPNPSFVIDTLPLGIASSGPSAALTADVQSWLDNPASNHGWLLKTDEAASSVTRKIDSRESTGTPPLLTVTYLLPAQTGTFGVGCPVGAGIFGYSFVGAAIGGTPINMVQISGPPGQLAANLLSLGFDPVGSPLLPNCLLHLPLGPAIVTHSIVQLDATGAAATSVVMPTGFPGLKVYAQSAALHGSPSGFVLSNTAIAFLQ